MYIKPLMKENRLFQKALHIIMEEAITVWKRNIYLTNQKWVGYFNRDLAILCNEK